MEKIEISKTEWEEVQKAVKDVTGLREDLQIERKGRIDAEAARDLAIAKAKENPEPAPDAVTAKATEIVNKTLEAKEKESVKDNYDKAFKAFTQSNKEFHPDSDAGGVKLAAFTAKLARINLNGLKTTEDFIGAFNEALTLMGLTPKEAPKYTPPAFESRTGGGSGPTPAETSNLSAKENQLIKQMGWTEERYLKVKASKPGYVQSLLKLIEG